MNFATFFSFVRDHKSGLVYNFSGKTFVSPDFVSSKNFAFSDTLLDIFLVLLLLFTNFEAKCGLKNSKNENCVYKSVLDLKLPAMFSIKVCETAI
jgi:hypothetical protein